MLHVWLQVARFPPPPPPLQSMARVMQFWRGPCGGTVDFPNFLKKSGVPEPDWAELLGVVRGAKREANNPLLPCAVFFSYAFFLGPAFLGALSRRWRRVCTKAEEEFNQKYSEKIGYQVLIDFDHGKLVFHPPVAAAEHSLFAPKTEEKSWHQRILRNTWEIVFFLFWGTFNP